MGFEAGIFGDYVTQQGPNVNNASGGVRLAGAISGLMVGNFPKNRHRSL